MIEATAVQRDSSPPQKINPPVQYTETAGIAVLDRSGMTPEQDVRSLASRWGEVGKELGRGREKRAREVGRDKVLVSYHQEHRGIRPIASAATPEYWQAMYHMHNVLHVLLPNNFPAVFEAVKGGIVVERIMDSDEMLRAKEINRKMREIVNNPEVSQVEHAWYDERMLAASTNPEFVAAIRLLKILRIIHNVSDVSQELSTPVNTTFRNNHPIFNC